jgi:hypothetical protein
MLSVVILSVIMLCVVAPLLLLALFTAVKGFIGQVLCC